MKVTKVGRALVTMVVVALVGAGCTPDADPTPTPPTPSASQTPTESAVERQQRLDYAAAEKSYRTFRAEYRRVLREGGASSATKTMQSTAGNGYLSETEDVVQGYKSSDYHQVGNEVIAFVRPGGYSVTSVLLDVCEDDRPVKALNAKGESLGPGELRRIQIRVEKKDGTWKLWDGTGQKVESCD